MPLRGKKSFFNPDGEVPNAIKLEGRERVKALKAMQVIFLANSKVKVKQREYIFKNYVYLFYK